MQLVLRLGRWFWFPADAGSLATIADQNETLS
jgi:hypothetical protein